MLVKYVIRIVITCYSYRWWFHKCVFNMFACIWGRCPIFTHRLRSTRRGNPLRILGFWGLQKKKKSGVQTALGNDTHTHIKHDMFCWFLMLCFELVLFWSMSEKVTYTDTIRWSTSIHHHPKILVNTNPIKFRVYLNLPTFKLVCMVVNIGIFFQAVPWKVWEFPPWKV